MAKAKTRSSRSAKVSSDSDGISVWQEAVDGRTKAIALKAPEGWHMSKDLTGRLGGVSARRAQDMLADFVEAGIAECVSFRVTLAHGIARYVKHYRLKPKHEWPAKSVSK